MCCMVFQPENGCFRAAQPKKWAFLHKTGLKMPILVLKDCFLGLGGLFKAPEPYFAGARLKKTSIAWYGSRKISVSGPPHPKNGHFLAKNGLKLPIFVKKAVFLCLGAEFKAPLPYFSGA